MAPRFFTCFSKPRNKDHRHPRSATGVNPAEDETDDPRRGGVGGVVVELFSSQGCAISPEAELLVSRLGRGDFSLDFPVIVLAFHVDYWDYMGWKDPYGSSQWTVRQKAYVESLNLDTMFTPQIVVQGRAQCVGNEEEALLSALSNAPKFPSPTFQATFQKHTEDNTLQVTLSGALRSKVDSEGVNVMVALYESNIITNCPRGENKDKVLSNDFIVRRLEKLCSVKEISAKKTLLNTVSFQLWEGFNSSKSGVAVFVQNSSHHIFGCQRFELPNNL